MRTRTLATATLFVAIAATFAARPAAAASPVEDQYRQVMRSFAPDIEQWVADTKVVLDAAVVKPEAACGAEAADLLVSSESIRADLVGTTRIVPARMLSVHYDLTETLLGMGILLETACSQPEIAVDGFQSAEARFDWAMAGIDNYIRNAHRGS
jgi:hypothetical protein